MRRTNGNSPVSTTDSPSLKRYDGDTKVLGGLTVDDVSARIKIGKQGAMAKFARLDRRAVDRFRDPGMTAVAGVNATVSSEEEDDYASDGDMPEEVKIGPSPKLTTSLYTKVAAICNKYPDYRAVMKPDAPDWAGEAPVAARRLFRKLWKDGNWQRISRKAYLKQQIAGMGFVAWFWDKEKRTPCYEHVQPQNLSVDPMTTDWQNLRYAARLIRIPLRDAMKNYPLYYAGDDQKSQSAKGRLDATKVKIWCYWDKNAEVHMLQDGWSCLKVGPNRYGGRIPILVAEGKIDPGFSIFGLGDGILAAGSQQEIEDIQNIISSKAKNNGPVTVYNSRILQDSKMLEDARDGQWIGSPDTTENPILRVPGETIENAEIEALRLACTSQDQLLGVSDSMRGALAAGNPTATEVSIVATQSSANSSDSKADYELFVNRWVCTTLWMMQEFGGKEKGKDVTDEDIKNNELLKWIEEVCVVESSSLFVDPGATLQQSQTLLQQAVNSSEMYLSFAQMGVAFDEKGPVIPNLKAYQDKVLRASGIENVDEYWMKAPAPPEQPQENDAAVLIKALQVIYQYSPADIQRQIEQQFGLSPSELGGVSPPEIAGLSNGQGQSASAQPHPEIEIAKQEDQQHHEAAMQSTQHGHDLRMQILKGNQQKELERVKLQHQAQVKLAEMQHQGRLQVSQQQAAEKQARITASARPTVGSNGKK